MTDQPYGLKQPRCPKSIIFDAKMGEDKAQSKEARIRGEKNEEAKKWGKRRRRKGRGGKAKKIQAKGLLPGGEMSESLQHKRARLIWSLELDGVGIGVRHLAGAHAAPQDRRGDSGSVPAGDLCTTKHQRTQKHFSPTPGSARRRNQKKDMKNRQRVCIPPLPTKKKQDRGRGSGQRVMKSGNCKRGDSSE